VEVFLDRIAFHSPVQLICHRCAGGRSCCRCFTQHEATRTDPGV